MQWFSFDTVTGENVIPLDPVDGSWGSELGRPDDVSVELRTDGAESFDQVWNLVAESTRSIGVDVGGQIQAAGECLRPVGSIDGSTVRVAGKGIRQFFDDVPILPPAAEFLPVDQWWVPSSEDPDEVVANPAVTSSYVDFDLGTIAKKIVQQSMTWPGGSLPIVFQDDRAGGHYRVYAGGDFAMVGRELDALQSLEGGPEIRFTPRWRATGRAVEFLMETGTEDQPLLASVQRQSFDMAVSEPSVRDVSVTGDASNVAGVSWATAGRTSGQALISRAVGRQSSSYPLRHRVDSSHSSIEFQSTLDSVASRNLVAGSQPVRTWSFDARTDRQPLLGTYRVGDYVTLNVAQGPDGAGRYEMRVVGMSGSLSDAGWVSLTCDPGRRLG